MTQLEEMIRMQAKNYAEKVLACSDVTIEGVERISSGRWHVKMRGKKFSSNQRLVVYVHQVPGDEDAVEATDGDFLI